MKYWVYCVCSLQKDYRSGDIDNDDTYFFSDLFGKVCAASYYGFY